MAEVCVSRDQTNNPPSSRAAALERLRGPKIGVSLAGSSGLRLLVDGVLRPVIALGEGSLRGRAATCAVSKQQPDGRLTPAPAETLNAVDLERLDLALMEKAFETFAPTPEGERPQLLVLPLSWSSLRTLRSRRRLLRLAASGQVRLRSLILCEVTGVEPGTPHSALREVAGQLQPIFRGVLARATPNRRVIRDLTDCGFTGATVDAADLGETEDAEAMLRAVLALQKIGPGLLVHAVRSVASLTAVRAAGASWASLDIVPGAVESARLAAHAKTAAGETPAAAMIES